MNDRLEEIHALVDGELSQEEEAQIREALAADPAAQREYQWAGAIKNLLHSKCARPTHEECWRRSMDQVRAIERSRRTNQFVGRWAWAMCLGVFLLIFGAAAFNRLNPSQSLERANLASLFGPLSRSASPETPSEADALVRSYLGAAPLSVDSIRFTVGEVGLGTVEGRRAARLRLADGSGPLILIVVQGVSGVEGLEGNGSIYSAGTVNGVPLIAWARNGYGMILSGPRSQSQLESIAGSLRR